MEQSIIIENQKFDFNEGCRITKLKYKECPFPELEGIWDDIQPLTFKEIAKMPNIEQRRVAINALGLERLTKEVNPQLICSETIRKSTCWVNAEGELESHQFNDTYELYKVDGKYFGKNTTGWRNGGDAFPSCYFVKCKDTSTDRDYLIWVDINSVLATNDPTKFNRWDRLSETEERNLANRINPIMAIAWTIQTNLPIGCIDKIVRQGDCILIKPRIPKGKKLDEIKVGERHLTADEYRTLLVAES